VSIFSDPVSQMLSKAWKGSFCLLNYMIKAYHRYVRHTSDLQKQAQSLLNDRSKDDAADKIKAEESELERLHLRAKIRTLEAELESMKMSKFGLERENDRMRKIIDVYITSSELNDPVFGLLSEDDVSINSAGQSQHGSAFDGHSVGSHSPNGEGEGSEHAPRRRTNAADAGRLQLKNLNRLDIELNEILSGVLTEENRQRVLMKDLLRLFDRNRLLLEGDFAAAALAAATTSTAGAASTLSSSAAAATATASSAAAGRKPSIIPRFSEAVAVGIQTDGKDEYNVVTDDDSPQPAAVNLLGVAPLAPPVLKVRGSDQPFQVRRLMQAFPQVQRIPPAAWTCNQIMCIYLDKINADQEAERRKAAKLPLGQFVHVYFTKTTGLHACADVQTAQLFKACESQIRLPRVAVFASQVGLLDKDAPPPLDVRDTEFVLLLLRTIAEQQQEQLHLQQLHDAKASKRKGAALLSKSSGGVLGSLGVSSDVNRAAVIAALQQLFRRLLPDGGEEVAMKVRAMPHSDKGVRFVDVDLVLQLALEPWRTVRSFWEEHAKFLFQQFCTVHRVISEVSFAGDDGTPAADSLLAEVLKEASEDCGRRPLRLFQKVEPLLDIADSKPTQQAKQGRKAAVTTVSGGEGPPVPSKEPVCEIMTRERFNHAVRTINPFLSLQEIDSMFDDALDISQEAVLRSLEQMWVKCVEKPTTNTHVHNTVGSLHERTRADTEASILSRSNSLKSTDSLLLFGRSQKEKPAQLREFYVNLNNQLHTQWTKPYSQKTFRSQDIELDAFVLILIRRDLFFKSPLLDKLNLSPKDLWPNADVFHKQLRDREKIKRDTTAADRAAAAASQALQHQRQLEQQQQEEQEAKRKQQETIRQQEEQEARRQQEEDEEASIAEDLAQVKAAPSPARTRTSSSGGSSLRTARSLRRP